MRMALLLVFLLLNALSYAEDKALYDTGQYDKACAVFEAMRTEPLTPLEYATVNYNIGTCLLAEGEAEEAVIQFHAVDLGRDPFPPLEERLNINKALALLQSAQHFIKDLKDTDADYIEKSNEVLLIVEAGLRSLERADKASQALVAFGLDPSTEKSLQIKNALELSIAHVNALKDKYAKTHVPIAEGILKVPTEPADVLKGMIKEQDHALHLNRMALLLSEPEPHFFVKDMQKRIVENEKAFLTAVYKEQQAEFDGTMSKEMREQCQDKWKGALSLYYKGNDVANRALQDLVAGFGFFPAAAIKQKAALHYWKQALDRLQQTQDKNKTTTPEKQLRKDNKIPSRDLWTLLEQMEIEDATLGEERHIQENERPW